MQIPTEDIWKIIKSRATDRFWLVFICSIMISGGFIGFRRYVKTLGILQNDLIEISGLLILWFVVLIFAIVSYIGHIKLISRQRTLNNLEELKKQHRSLYNEFCSIKNEIILCNKNERYLHQYNQELKNLEEKKKQIQLKMDNLAQEIKNIESRLK